MREPQSPWEETPEEARKRIETARSPKSGWIGTAIGLILAILALAGLTMMPLPKTW